MAKLNIFIGNTKIMHIRREVDNPAGVQREVPIKKVISPIGDSKAHISKVLSPQQIEKERNIRKNQIVTTHIQKEVPKSPIGENMSPIKKIPVNYLIVKDKSNRWSEIENSKYLRSKPYIKSEVINSQNITIKQDVNKEIIKDVINFENIRIKKDVNKEIIKDVINFENIKIKKDVNKEIIKDVINFQNIKIKKDVNKEIIKDVINFQNIKIKQDVIKEASNSSLKREIFILKGISYSRIRKDNVPVQITKSPSIDTKPSISKEVVVNSLIEKCLPQLDIEINNSQNKKTELHQEVADHFSSADSNSQIKIKLINPSKHKNEPQIDNKMAISPTGNNGLYIHKGIGNSRIFFRKPQINIKVVNNTALKNPIQIHRQTGNSENVRSKLNIPIHKMIPSIVENKPPLGKVIVNLPIVKSAIHIHKEVAQTIEINPPKHHLTKLARGENELLIQKKIGSISPIRNKLHINRRLSDPNSPLELHIRREVACSPDKEKIQVLPQQMVNPPVIIKNQGSINDEEPRIKNVYSLAKETSNSPSVGSMTNLHEKVVISPTNQNKPVSEKEFPNSKSPKKKPHKSKNAAKSLNIKNEPHILNEVNNLSSSQKIVTSSSKVESEPHIDKVPKSSTAKNVSKIEKIIKSPCKKEPDTDQVAPSSTVKNEPHKRKVSNSQNVKSESPTKRKKLSNSTNITADPLQQLNSVSIKTEPSKFSNDKMDVPNLKTASPASVKIKTPPSNFEDKNNSVKEEEEDDDEEEEMEDDFLSSFFANTYFDSEENCEASNVSKNKQDQDDGLDKDFISIEELKKMALNGKKINLQPVEKRLSCDECNFNTDKKWNLDRHYRQIHLKGGKKLNCDHCSYKTSLISSFWQHIETEHLSLPVLDVKNEKTDDKTDKKKDNTKETDGKVILEISKKDTDDKGTLGTVGTPEIKSESPKEDKLKRFACTECKYRATRNALLQRHIKGVHLGEKNLQCILCDFRTNYAKSLERHVTAHHTGYKRFICTYCEMSFNRKDGMDVHINRQHLNIREYACERCEYTTGVRAHLTRHIENIHELTKDISCNLCPFKTHRNTNLVRHMHRMHNKDKNCFKCQHCDYQSKIELNYDRHVILTHQ